ncbi:MAG: hypothetical protein HY870_13175 [Chloroflexi bacterium]|nr:hypothetical protein [Chloroflexota bacterium]
MDSRLIREYRARYQAVAEIEIEEQRSATIVERWQQLIALWRLAAELNLPESNRTTDESAVFQRWARLKGAE